MKTNWRVECALPVANRIQTLNDEINKTTGAGELI